MKKFLVFNVLAVCFAINLQAQVFGSCQVSNSSFCAGDTIVVTYDFGGDANYQIELSNSMGSFDNPIKNYPKQILGNSQNSIYGGNGILTAVIPFSVSPGTRYRIRVIRIGGFGFATSVAYSSDNGFNITLKNVPATPTITAGGATTFCSGDSVVLTSSAGSTYLWSNGESSQSIKVKISGNYNVKVTNAGSCYSAASESTKVNTAASITAGGPTTFCSGGSVVLTATPGSRYLWNTGATAQSITATSSGTYTVQVFANNNCTLTASSSVTVNASPSVPTITASGATTFCSGDSVLLTSSAGSTYLWNNGESSQSIKVKTSGNYSVKVTNASSCYSDASEFTTVNTAASITAGGSTTFCSGGSVLLTATSGSSYLWNTGATTPSIVATSSGTYSVQIVINNGCTFTASTSVTVNPSVADITATQSYQTNIISSTVVNNFLGSATPNVAITTQRTPATSTINITGSSQYIAANTRIEIGMNINLKNDLFETRKIFLVGPNKCGAMSLVGSPYLDENKMNVTLHTTGSFSPFPLLNDYDADGFALPIMGDFNTFGGITNGPDASEISFINYNESLKALIPTTSLKSGNCPINGNWQLVAYHSIDESILNDPQYGFSTDYKLNSWSLKISEVKDSTASTINCGKVLTASVGSNYLWSNGATTQSITATQSGNYSVKVTNASGCVSTSPVAVVTLNCPNTQLVSFTPTTTTANLVPPSIGLPSAGIGVGSSSMQASAQLEVQSNSKGFLPPRMTAAERDAIVSPVTGLMLYCSNCGTYGEVETYNGTSWTNILGGAVASVVGSTTTTSIVSDLTNFNIKSATVVAVDQLDITPSANFSLNTGIVRNTSYTNALPNNAISRFYKFGANTNPFSGVLKIYYAESELNSLPEGNLRIFYHNGFAWNLDANGSNNASSNFVLSSTLSNIILNELTVSVNVAPILPVTGLKLNGYATATANLLNWYAYNEREMNDYTIERSLDGLIFNTIGNQLASVTTNGNNNYNYSDNNPLNGLNYYRIKGNSNNGQIQFSNITTIRFGSKQPTLLVAPNPVEYHLLSLKVVQLNKGVYTLQISDAIGRLVSKRLLFYVGGSGAIKTSLPQTIKAGVYYVKLIGEGSEFTEKFIIQ